MTANVRKVEAVEVQPLPKANERIKFLLFKQTIIGPEHIYDGLIDMKDNIHDASVLLEQHKSISQDKDAKYYILAIELPF